MTTRFHLRPPLDHLVFQLHGRPIHPELFDILAARRIKRGDCVLDLWLTTSGHVISWHGARSQLTEITATDAEAPAWGHLLSHPLPGQRSDQIDPAPELDYRVSFQVECLSPDQFLTVHREILADGGQRGLLHAYAPNHRWALTPVSAIHVESRDGCLSL